jgi:hypothetical protein
MERTQQPAPWHPRAEPGRPEEPDLYASPPPWDIGRPQPAFLGLARAGLIRGRVLDAGRQVLPAVLQRCPSAG